MQKWLQADNVRLIGITGTGGYGKSSLVAKVFATAQSFEKQVWATFSQNYPFAVWGRWLLEKLGKATPEKEADLLTAVCNNLRTGRYLLVLDNLETLLEANGEWHDKTYYDFLLRWLSSHTESVILVTSREQPQLPPNSLNYCRWLPLKGLSTDAGVALLEDLDIQGADAQMQEFVKQADGHPLLIKLVAGVLHADEGDVVDISALRQNIFEILGLHRYESEASIGKILDASIARLTPKLQQLLFNLSVYRPAFNATAAAALLPEEEVTQPDLRGLVKRSLLQENKIESGWVFEFQPLILAYLKQQAGDLTEVHERGIAYYQSIAKKSWQTIEDITPQLEIFHHHCELKQYRQAYKILNYCYNFLDLRGYYTTIIELSSRLEKEWQPTNQDENIGFAGVLTSLGSAYQSLGQYQIAIDYYQQSLTIYREIGNRKGEASSLNNLGNTYDFLGQYQIAIDYHQQSLAIFIEIGDRKGEANSLHNSGGAYYSLGEYQQAIDLYKYSLVIKREIDDRKGEANSLNNLGNTYNSLGEYQIAIDYAQQSLTIYREIVDRKGEASSLNNLSNAYNSLGEYQIAIDYAQQSLAIKLEISDRNGKADSLNNFNNTNIMNNMCSYNYSISFHEIGDRKGEAQSLQNLSQLYNLTGRIKEGYAVGFQATQIQQELELPIEAWAIPKWQKSLVKFAQRGKLQLGLCFLLGLFAFPFALVFIVSLMLWRVVKSQLLRR
jgi:tetratricopeptide (TPR) repeat protein